MNILLNARGEPRLELGVHRLWDYVELFWNSLDNAPSSIVFYLEMIVEVEVSVHEFRSRFTPRLSLSHRFSNSSDPFFRVGMSSISFAIFYLELIFIIIL